MGRNLTARTQEYTGGKQLSFIKSERGGKEGGKGNSYRAGWPGWKR